jgi:predicted amidohydrolase
MSGDIRGRVAIVQMDCVLGQIQPNLEKIGRFAEAAGRLGADLVIFPECATTGYFMADRLNELAEPPDGPSLRALAGIAAANRLYLAAGVVVAEDGRHFDSQVLFGPDGTRLALYHKVHLFSAERDSFTAGDRPVVAETTLGTIGLSVCYDLIFGEYIRRLVGLGAELIINSTNWIADAYQREVWGWSGPTTQGLAATRALENVAFVAMSNRVGHEVGFDSLGHSCIAAPSGKVLASIPAGEGVAVADLGLPHDDLERWRSIATYRRDQRPEIYR